MAKRYFRPKHEARNIRLAKYAVVAVLALIFFALLSYLYAGRYSGTAVCLRPAVEEAIMAVAAGGGYLAPESTVQYNSYSVPIYMSGGKENVPSLDDTAASMLEYVKEARPECSENIAVSYGRSVKAGRFLGHASVDVDMQHIYSEAMLLYAKQKSAGAISLADLARMAKHGDYVLHINANNSTALYLLSFTKEKINRNPVVYAFGIMR